MTFVTARDLRLKPAEVWERLKEEGEVVVTVNGRPRAIITGTSPEDLEESLLVLKRLRAETAVAKMRAAAAQRGLGKMPLAEVEKEVRAVRRGRA